MVAYVCIKLNRLWNEAIHFMDATLLQSQFDTLEIPNYGIKVSCEKSQEDFSQNLLFFLQSNQPSCMKKMLIFTNFQIKTNFLDIFSSFFQCIGMYRWATGDITKPSQVTNAYENNNHVYVINHGTHSP